MNTDICRKNCGISIFRVCYFSRWSRGEKLEDYKKSEPDVCLHDCIEMIDENAEMACLCVFNEPLNDVIGIDDSDTLQRFDQEGFETRYRGFSSLDSEKLRGVSPWKVEVYLPGLVRFRKNKVPSKIVECPFKSQHEEFDRGKEKK